LRVVLHSSRPGTVIGPKGADADKLRDALETLTGRKVKIEVSEVANPDLNAQLIAENIGEQLKKRVSFRRAVRQKLDAAMSAGAKGVKIQLAGRIGGAEIARTEKFLLGSIPLQTLQADVNYGLNHCRTPYGVLGIKVWVYRGLYSETENLDNTRKSGPRRPRRR
jgi:small subunit ribosomal protein S3